MCGKKARGSMRIRCPACGHEVPVPEGADRNTLTCPQCNARLQSDADKSDDHGKESDGRLLDDIMGEVRKLKRQERLGASAASQRIPSAGKSGRERSRRAAVKHYPDAAPTVAWGQVIAVTVGLLLVLTAGFLAIRHIRSSVHIRLAQNTLRRAQGTRDAIRDMLQSADENRSKKRFKMALADYETVVLRSRRLLRHLNDADRNLRDGAMKEKIAAAMAEMERYLKRGIEGESVPEVKFGAQGRVEFEGKWVTAERGKELFEAKMRAEGRQLYNGEWLTDTEIHEAKGEVLYRGRWVTRAQYAALLAAEKRGTPPITAPPPGARTLPRAPSFKDSSPQWVIDNFEDGRDSWRSVPWQKANPCSVSVESGTATKRLRVTMLGGKFDKFALVRRIPLNFKSRSRLVMDIFNNCREPVRIALAFDTDGYYESRWKTLKTGANNNFSFNLDTGDFKCAGTHWAHASYLAHPESLKHIYILLYYDRPGEIFIDNVAAVGGK